MLNIKSNRSVLSLLTVVALLVGACGGTVDTAETTSTTEVSSTTTTVPATTTTVEATTTTTSALDRLGYTVSDEWVVETVVRDIDSGTGGIYVDSDGTIYQSDFGIPANSPGDSVYRIDLDGTVETFTQSDLMGKLTMIARGADGEIYQSSYGTDRVFTIDDNGEPTLIAEGISGPTGIVGLEDGTLFVEGFNSNTIFKVLPDGTVERFVSHIRFNGINGLTSGPDGTLYVVNYRDGGLFAVDQEGGVTDLHKFPSQLSHVLYLDGSLFITSRGGYVIFRYDLESGEAEVIAGNGRPGDMDGRGGEASFGRPNAIALGPDGALYFNHGTGTNLYPVTIRRIVHRP